jgi:hypothetical protein
MKRKVYSTRRERLRDRLIGLVAAPLVNIPLGIILWIIPQTAILSRTSDLSLLLVMVSALPWLVNGIVIVLAFLLRPEFGFGYIVCLGGAIALVTALSALFVAACFVTLISATMIREQAQWVFIFLMVIGMCGLALIAIYLFVRWLLS